MGWQDVVPSEDVDVADWIRHRLHGFAEDVGSVIPSGFTAYARIFHPAVRLRVAAEDPEVELRWSDVAAVYGKTVHPEMQFHTIVGHALFAPQVELAGFYEPREGVLSLSQSAALVQRLARHTSTPNECWFCLWDGYGDLHPGSIRTLTSHYVGTGLPRLFRILALKLRPYREPPRRFPSQVRRVKLPEREYFMFKGSVAQAAGWDEGPNLWWPEDRAWCVASEIDFPYTYVGGSQDLIDEIVHHSAIEALPSALDHGITADSDKINS
ncbi:MAG: hypothetical protein ACHQ0J_00810 [Candidatus Dormibacterales bacterium]